MTPAQKRSDSPSSTGFEEIFQTRQQELNINFDARQNRTDQQISGIRDELKQNSDNLAAFQQRFNAVFPPSHSYEPVKKEEHDVFDHATGGFAHPRPDVHLKSGKVFNVWNTYAPFGNPVHQWEEDDQIIIRRVGGSVDPYELQNLNQAKCSTVVGHLKR
ncbi:MAG: hypothetical protein JSS32_06055 [Verrucomicrobia bacterium]|nr:hypothetical protein [Verrucomicrobiota bacterium]